MLKTKNLEQQMEAVRIYKDAQRREKIRRQKEVADIAWRCLEEGQITVWDYQKICRQNNQPTKC